MELVNFTLFGIIVGCFVWALAMGINLHIYMIYSDFADSIGLYYTTDDVQGYPVLFEETITLPTGWCVIEYSLDSCQKTGIYRRVRTYECPCYAKLEDFTPLYINKRNLKKLDRVARYMLKRR